MPGSEPGATHYPRNVWRKPSPYDDLEPAVKPAR
jgi:hypothetical protein